MTMLKSKSKTESSSSRGSLIIAVTAGLQGGRLTLDTGAHRQWEG